MGKLIDGKKIARNIDSISKQKVEKLKEQGLTPKLVVVLVGHDKPSIKYVSKKEASAKNIGIDFKLVNIQEKISTKELIDKITEIQKDESVSGIIVQLPLPDNIETISVLEAIKPELDVDYLTKINQKKLELGTNTMTPPTPGAIMEILKDLNVELKNKNVVVIGKGPLVGKPIANIMKNAGANVVICDSKTSNTKEKCLDADIIITGVGKKDILRGDMIKEGATVIDGGNCFVDGKLYGDVNVNEVLEKAHYVTPTPGGVGPITVAMLLSNTVISCKYNKKMG